MDSMNPTTLRTPWHLSPSLYQRLPTHSNLTYRKCPVTSQDPEWNLIHHLFQLYKPNNYSIATIYCIHNSDLTNQFQASIATQEKEAYSSTFTPKWTQESPLSLRQKVMQRWTALITPYTPFSIQWPNQRKDIYTRTKVLPLWHGTTASICDSICTTGFTTFGKHEIIHGTGKTQNTDIGYFGSGIYFTTSAKYATATYSDGNILLAWVSMREPYPVVADQLCSPPHKPVDMQKLQGLGAYQNYNAHYIPVVSVNPSNPNCATYYPCTDSQTPAWDEVVVFQKSQTLPSFWIQLQPDFLTTPTATTINHLLDHLLQLLDNPAVQSDSTLSQLLDQKCQQLANFNLHGPLTPSDQEFYTWSLKLFDEAGKVRNYVQKKLQQTPPSSPFSTPQSFTPPTTFPSNVVSPWDGYVYGQVPRANEPIPPIKNKGPGIPPYVAAGRAGPKGTIPEEPTISSIPPNVVVYPTPAVDDSTTECVKYFKSLFSHEPSQVQSSPIPPTKILHKPGPQVPVPTPTSSPALSHTSPSFTPALTVSYGLWEPWVDPSLQVSAINTRRTHETSNESIPQGDEYDGYGQTPPANESIPQGNVPPDFPDVDTW
jgi:hypothetical protein